MKHRNLLTTIALGTIIAASATPVLADSCGSGAKATHASATATTTIFKTAEQAGFTTLVAAVKAAGLEDVLNSKGPFTVFAPTDEAFAKLPAGTVESLLKDPAALKSILLYHVVSGEACTTRSLAPSPEPGLPGLSSSLQPIRPRPIVRAAITASRFLRLLSFIMVLSLD